jgi:hypothetical protein
LLISVIADQDITDAVVTDIFIRTSSLILSSQPVITDLVITDLAIADSVMITDMFNQPSSQIWLFNAVLIWPSLTLSSVVAFKLVVGSRSRDEITYWQSEQQ